MFKLFHVRPLAQGLSVRSKVSGLDFQPKCYFSALKLCNFWLFLSFAAFSAISLSLSLSLSLSERFLHSKAFPL